MKKIILLILVLMIPLTSGIGLSPAKLEKVYTPGEQIINFNILDSKTATITIGGNLAEYATAPSNVKSGEFSVELDLPKNLEPGIYKLEVTAAEPDKGTGTIRTRLQVKSIITLISLFEGVYLRAFIPKKDYQANEEFIVEITNWGQGDSELASVGVQIWQENKLKGTLNSELKQIPSQETVSFKSPWSIDLRPGNYLAKAFVAWENQKTSFERKFKFGKQTLELIDAKTIEFNKNKNARIQLSVVNEWSEKLNSGYAEIEFTRNEKSLGGSPTTITGFNSYEIKNLTTNWNLEGVENGPLNLTITLYYNNDQHTINLPAELTRRGLFIDDEEPGIDWLIITLIALILLIIGVIILLAENYLRRNENNSERFK